MKFKRKGNTVEIPIWLIVVLFAALIIIFMQTDMAAKARKYIPFFRECTDIAGGKCAAVSNCNQLTDNAYMMSTERCKGEKEICCIADKTSPYYTPPANAKECTGKANGDSCGASMLCMKTVTDNLECTTKCVYCANNPTDTTNCKVSTSILFGKSITQLDSTFSCHCTGGTGTDRDCNAGTTGFTCVRNMCPSMTANDPAYMCCNK